MHFQHVALTLKPTKNQAVGVSVSHLDLGDIQLAGPTGALLPIESPFEMAVNFSYAYALSEHLSSGLMPSSLRPAFSTLPPALRPMG